MNYFIQVRGGGEGGSSFSFLVTSTQAWGD